VRGRGRATRGEGVRILWYISAAVAAGMVIRRVGEREGRFQAMFGLCSRPLHAIGNPVGAPNLRYKKPFLGHDAKYRAVFR
jgi:hypothetical protein